MTEAAAATAAGVSGRSGPRTVRGVLSVFPQDVGPGEDGKERFNPATRVLVHPTASIARKYGDRRAPQRAVEFEVAADEFFSVHRYSARNAAGSAAVSVGSFIDYRDAYAALVDNVPAGNRGEIRIMTPTRAEVVATGTAGEDVVIGESITWQARGLADRLRFVVSGR